jgi:hypothetical protein
MAWVSAARAPVEAPAPKITPRMRGKVATNETGKRMGKALLKMGNPAGAVNEVCGI